VLCKQKAANVSQNERSGSVKITHGKVDPNTVLAYMEWHCHELIDRNRDARRLQQFMLLQHSGNQVETRVQALLRHEPGCEIDLFIQSNEKDECGRDLVLSSFLSKRIEATVKALGGVEAERYAIRSVLRVYKIPVHVSIRAWLSQECFYVGWYLANAAMYSKEADELEATPFGHNTESILFKPNHPQYASLKSMVESVPRFIMTAHRDKAPRPLCPCLVVRERVPKIEKFSSDDHWPLIDASERRRDPHEQGPCSDCWKVLQFVQSNQGEHKTTRADIAQSVRNTEARALKRCFEFLLATQKWKHSRPLLRDEGHLNGLKLTDHGKRLLAQTQ